MVLGMTISNPQVLLKIQNFAIPSSTQLHEYWKQNLTSSKADHKQYWHSLTILVLSQEYLGYFCQIWGVS